MSRIKVNFDENGDGYIADEKINDMLVPYTTKIQQLESALAQQGQVMKAKEAREDMVNDVLSTDNSFKDAYTDLRKAHKWLNLTTIALQENKGLTGSITPNEASELYSDNVVEEEFNKLFPGIDMNDVLFASSSKHHLNKALENISANSVELGDEYHEANDLGAILDSGRITPLDIVDMSDEQAAKLVSKLAEEG